MLTALTGLWFVCFVLHLGQVVQGRLAWIPVYVAAAAGPDAAPTVRALWPGVSERAIAPGDAIGSVAEITLAGASPLDFVAAVYARAAGGHVQVERVRAGESAQVELALSPIETPWRRSVAGAGFALMGALAFWRTRGSRIGRSFYFGMTAYAFHWTDFWAAAPFTKLGVTSFGLATTLFMPLALRTALIFPEDAVPERKRIPLWPWIFALNGPVVTSWAFGVPFGWAHAQLAALVLQVAFIAVFVGLLTRRYREAGPIGRRQLKWVMVGLWVGLVPALLAGGVVFVEPALWWVYDAALALTVVLPVCLFIAFARYNLLDIDRLVTTAAISPLIGAGLISFGLVSVPAAASAAQGWIDPKVSQPALTLVLAGATFLALRRMDRWLQERVYPERRILALEAQALRLELAQSPSASELLALLARRVGEILKLVTTATYARGERAFQPVFARGPAVSPAFALDGSLAHVLSARAAPFEPTAPWPDGDPAEREALAAMGVELAVPVLVRGELAGFLCLGGKRSGDVFTPTDRALLQSLADKAADELLQFDREDLARETQALVEKLRAYVPGAVARELQAGASLEAGEREITVLFVDIRGYTAFSEGQRPEAIFGAVSAYTQVVSQIVTDCGGAIVEFNGDGLMTVFGAPRALPDKERAAVRAARAIAQQVPALAVRDAAGHPHQFHVGIGVATGPGYVGNVKAVDRAIWVALGNTTNLAARLERMTRELHAAVVIDAETYKAAGDAGEDFALQPSQRVRGRSALVDVYAWAPPGTPTPPNPPSTQEEAT
jgi:class 3 adenylate cyclase